MINATLRKRAGVVTTGSFNSEFLEAIQTMGRMITAEIYQDGVLLYSTEDIVSLSRSNEAGILKSVMYQYEIELNQLVNLVGADFSEIRFGVSGDAGQTYYYISFGAAHVIECEQNLENGTTKLLAYDLMVNAMTEYDLTPEYPMTNYAYLSAVCSRLGFGVGESIPNTGAMALTRSAETYTSAYTFRDVLDDFAEVLGGSLIVKGGSLELLTVSNTGMSVDGTNLRKFTLLEEFPQVTGLVLSRSPQEDNVSTGNDSGSVIRLDNNQIVEGNPESGGAADRTVYLNFIYTALSEWGAFFPFEFESFGFGLFEPGDLFTLTVGETNEVCMYQCGDFNITQGLEEKAASEAPVFSETDYSKSTDESIRELNTYLTVNKVEGEISAVAQQVEENKESIANLNIRANEIVSMVSETRTELIDGYTSVIDEFGNQAANTYATKSELSQTASQISATITEVSNTVDELGNEVSTTQQAVASLSIDGLTVNTGGQSSSRIDSDGLKVIGSDGTVIAEFTNQNSAVDYLKVRTHLSFGAHRAEAAIDTEHDNTSRTGTAFFWTGDVV